MCNYIIFLNKGDLPFNFKAIYVLVRLKSYYSKNCSSPKKCPHIYYVFISDIDSPSFHYKISFKPFLFPRSLWRPLIRSSVLFPHAAIVSPYICHQTLATPHCIAFLLTCMMAYEVCKVRIHPSNAHVLETAYNTACPIYYMVTCVHDWVGVDVSQYSLLKQMVFSIWIVSPYWELKPPMIIWLKCLFQKILVQKDEMIS